MQTENIARQVSERITAAFKGCPTCGAAGQPLTPENVERVAKGALASLGIPGEAIVIAVQ